MVKKPDNPDFEHDSGDEVYEITGTILFFYLPKFLYSNSTKQGLLSPLIVAYQVMNPIIEEQVVEQEEEVENDDSMEMSGNF